MEGTVLLRRGETVEVIERSPAELADEVADRMAAFYAGFYSEYLQHNDILEPLAQAMTIEYGRQWLAAAMQPPAIRLRKEADNG